ncbi:hypothetical protein H4K33_10435 [Myroides sp. WP-1]|nr:hypothetical protein [Myroides sp. WP-1]
MDDKQMMHPNPKTGIKNGLLWFFNELWMTIGPRNNKGSVIARYLTPFCNTLRFVP